MVDNIPCNNSLYCRT